MILKNNVVLKDYLTDEEPNNLIKEYKLHYRVYERLTFIKLIKFICFKIRLFKQLISKKHIGLKVFSINIFFNKNYKIFRM
jgi:hypothetical protein